MDVPCPAAVQCAGSPSRHRVRAAAAVRHCEALAVFPGAPPAPMNMCMRMLCGYVYLFIRACVYVHVYMCMCSLECIFVSLDMCVLV